MNLKYNADAATAVLFMCSVHAVINGVDLVLYAPPWSALAKCADLREAGATEIALYAGGASRSAWYWFESGERMANFVRGLAA